MEFKPIVLQFPPLSEEELLKRFQGKVTGATLDAVRRMKAKRQGIAVPAHLAGKLWRATGGWAQDFSPVEIKSQPVQVSYVEAIRAQKLGDLLVVLFKPRYGGGFTIFLRYRGIIVELPSQYWNPQAKWDQWNKKWEGGNAPLWKVELLKEFWTLARPLSRGEAEGLGFQIKT